MRTVARAIVFSLSLAMVAFAAGVLWVNGSLPGPVPGDAPPYSLSPLAEVLGACIDARGQVDLTELKKHHAALETFVRSLAKTSPDSTPELFPTVEARLAYWLNAYHALVLLELLDTRATRTSHTAELFDGVTIGGKHTGRWAITRNFLDVTGDARVFLAVATGAKGRGVLDGAPFDTDSINLQLDDAVRRFVRRTDHVSVDGKRVKVSSLFRDHREDFLAALPEERKNVLQIVWAYLPETCESGQEGCATRADLDRACGTKFDGCQVEFVEPDETLAVKN
ncbi:MAG: DUF547 domain-containing protein [Myxococcaceae bacterium]